MSILPPNTNQGTASPDYPSSAPPNPSNHGFLPPSRLPPHSSSDSPTYTTTPTIDSLRISDPAPSASALDADSGSVAQASPNDHGGSSRKVITGFGRSSAKNHIHRSSVERTVECPVGEDGVAQPNTGRLSGYSGSPPNRTSGSAGRRAQVVNGNHLLNFHYDPITRSQPRGGLVPSRKSRGTGKPRAYNKDLFLQANYKFVVLDAGNYDVESMDPDKMLDWEDIICVKYSTPYPVQCPICLETPLCPQITSCGHIFCFPCILQYLLMGEENLKRECWKKCPLCFMMISSKELYTIYAELVKHHQVGDAVEFTLLAREKDSFALYPKNQNRDNAVPFEQFSKFILTSDVELSVREAMCDLDSWLASADAGLVDNLEKLPYVCAAMEQLEKRKKYWNEHRISGGRKDTKKAVYEVSESKSSVNNTIKAESPTSAVGTLNISVDSIGQDIVDVGCCAVLSSETEKIDTEKDYSLSSSYDKNKTLGIQSCHSRGTMEKERYNFYQVVDGQNITLHPLNMKCLLHHYVSYDLLPPRITGRILELESVTQSDAIRKRFRYLSHFPLTATFQFCEIDLSGTLPADSPSPFIDQIKKREKQRMQLAKKEQKDKIKAEAVTAYYAPPSSYSPSFHDDEPAFSMDDFEALGSDTSASRVPRAYEERNLFSNVARLGFAAGHDSPTLNTEASTGSNMERTSSSTTPTGSGNQGVTSFASVISRVNTDETRNVSKMNETKKGRKASRVLLSNAGIRRY